LEPKQDEINREINCVTDLVNMAQDGVIPPFIARSELAELGWVLRNEESPFSFAQHCQSHQCGSCQGWESLGFHMGILDGRCLKSEEDRKAEERCSGWQPLIDPPSDSQL